LWGCTTRRRLGRLGAVVRGEPCRWDVASESAAAELTGLRWRREEEMEAGGGDGGGKKRWRREGGVRGARGGARDR